MRMQGALRTPDPVSRASTPWRSQRRALHKLTRPGPSGWAIFVPSPPELAQKLSGGL